MQWENQSEVAKENSASHSAVSEVFLLVCNLVCVCVHVSDCRQDNSRCRSHLPPCTRQGLSLAVCCSAHPSSRPSSSWISPVSTCCLTAPTAELRPHGFYSTSRHSTSGSHACVASSSSTWLSCQPNSGILEAGHQRRKEKFRGI